MPAPVTHQPISNEHNTDFTSGQKGGSSNYSFQSGDSHSNNHWSETWKSSYEEHGKNGCDSNWYKSGHDNDHCKSGYDNDCYKSSHENDHCKSGYDNDCYKSGYENDHCKSGYDHCDDHYGSGSCGDHGCYEPLYI